MLNLSPMSETENRWEGYLQPDWLLALDDTSFLSRCRAGTISHGELNTFLVQQYFYASHFTRYLSALLSNIVNEVDRRKLTENLVDETGLGVEKGIPHSVLYRQMLTRLELDPMQYSMTVETQNLIEIMLESCRNPNMAVGLGALCLGAEAIVPHLYRQIVHGFESQGYTKKDLEFFYLHIDCDDDHALTMKEMIEREIVEPRKRLALQCSAARVIAARARFFGSLSAPAIQWKELEDVAV